MILSSVNSFIPSLMTHTPCIYFSCLITLARTSSTELKSRGAGTSCLAPDLSGKASSFLPWSTTLTVGILWMFFLKLTEFPFILTLMRIIIVKGCWIFGTCWYVVFLFVACWSHGGLLSWPPARRVNATGSWCVFSHIVGFLGCSCLVEDFRICALVGDFSSCTVFGSGVGLCWLCAIGLEVLPLLLFCFSQTRICTSRERAQLSFPFPWWNVFLEFCLHSERWGVISFDLSCSAHI